MIRDESGVTMLVEVLWLCTYCIRLLSASYTGRILQSTFTVNCVGLLMGVAWTTKLCSEYTCYQNLSR